MKTFLVTMSVVSFLVTVVLSSAVAQMPRTLNYQGTLATGSTPVPDGNYNVTFRLYAASSGGSAVWTEAQLVATRNGVFNAILGKSVPLPASFNTPYWMSLQVGADPELAPRLEMTGVSYSLQSGISDSTRKVANGSIGTAQLANGAVTNATVATAAAIAASKISGDAGVKYTSWGSNFYTVTASDATVHNMGSLVINAPTAGYVIAVLTGYVVFGGDNKTLVVGVNTASDAITEDWSVSIGRLDGSGTNRFEEPFTAMAATAVSAGTTTFYALAQGNTTFPTGNANVVPQTLVLLFVPKTY